ncbi:hypothetical protein Pcinc_008897 [Petrolisthes cinctipes]|nr:hypothetical protein Pcinc_008897 [Petrolisthes cinctipes]
MDASNQLGGVTVRQGNVQFGSAKCSLIAHADTREEKGVSVIEDKDFRAEFDGTQWTVEWFWKEDRPVKLKNKMCCYKNNLKGRIGEEFEKEVDRWIEEGILVPWVCTAPDRSRDPTSSTSYLV